MSGEEYTGLDQLGRHAALPESPEAAVFEGLQPIQFLVPGIAKRLQAEIEPQWLRIGGYWYPRGGIPIDVFYQLGVLPEDVWLPDQGVAPYRGRG